MEFFCLSLDSVAPPLNALVPTFCPLKRHVATLVWPGSPLISSLLCRQKFYDGGAREDLVMGGEGLNDTRSLKVEGEKGMWFEDHECHELSAKNTVHYLSSTVDLPRRIFHGLGNVTWLSGPGFRFLQIRYLGDLTSTTGLMHSVCITARVCLGILSISQC